MNLSYLPMINGETFETVEERERLFAAAVARAAVTIQKYARMTIADIAIAILIEEGDPLSVIEMARRAIAGGYDADGVDRARSKFSATISKDIRSGRRRFWQVGRGQIGLIEWKPILESGMDREDVT